MSSSNTESSKANPRFRREAQSSESSCSKAASSPKATSQAATPPSSASSDPESIELGVDPTTILTANIFDRPSSMNKIREYINVRKAQLVSQASPPSQYLLLRRIPAHLFNTLKQESELLKGIRATIVHHENQILYKMVLHYHEKVITMFNTWINTTLAAMGLLAVAGDLWLGGAGRSFGLLSDKEADSSFFPGRAPGPGVPIPWPSFVLEVGVSESTPQLRTDARWWYSNSSQQTQLVVLISADTSTHDADIEIWTPVINSRAGVTTRGRSTHILQCTKSAKLRNGVVSGDALELDFQMVMGRPPQNPQESNLRLPPLWIQSICK